MNSIRRETGTVYTHVLVRRAAICQIDQLHSVTSGQAYFRMTANVMIFHTLEAYLNFAGEFVFPKEWASERKYFSKKPYQGILGKLRFLCEAAHIDLDTHPAFVTVTRLKSIRDAIAHGKILQHDITFHPRDELDCVKLPLLDYQPNPDSALRDIENICEEIHTALRVSDAHLIHKKAFSGLLLESSGSENRIST